MVKLVGKRYGKLVVVEFAFIDTNGSKHWHCVCDCGNDCFPATGNLIGGSARSCGCSPEVNAELINGMRKRATKHGCSQDRVYGVWKAMMGRCYNKNDHAYKNYGGRGISVCEEWKDCNKFKAWAYANGYDETAKHGKCTLDRVDVNGKYSPENCRFVSMKEQNNNKRDNRIVVAFGTEMTFAEAADKYCINKSTFRNRLLKGMSVDEALSVPVSHHKSWKVNKHNLNNKQAKETKHE